MESREQMEETVASSNGSRRPSNSNRKHSQDGKQLKKRKTPRYWSTQQKDDDIENSKVKKYKSDIEEITIDPMVLKKYTRGKGVDLKVLILKKLFVDFIFLYFDLLEYISPSQLYGLYCNSFTAFVMNHPFPIEKQLYY